MGIFLNDYTTVRLVWRVPIFRFTRAPRELLSAFDEKINTGIKSYYINISTNAKQYSASVL